MRTVTGPTDRVVIVGAGLGGLSAALRLAGAGRQVTVLERSSVPGGRAGLWAPGGYRIDTGPTVLTMPDLIADAFACVGEELTDWLDLRPVDPLYRAFFADGTQLDVYTDLDAMAEQVATVISPDEAAGYRRYVAFLHRLYRLEMDAFIDRNVDSPWDLLRPQLAPLVAAGGFRRLAGKVAQYLKDPRTQRIMSFQSMYAGLSPYDAAALYAVIAYMDSVAGVYFPVGGMHAVGEAMAAAATRHGVDIRYDTEVVRVESRSGRAVAVHTAAGERVPLDVIVLNADLPVAYRDLLGHTPARVRRLRYSPSCVLLLAGSTATYSRTAHHNLHFGRQWRGVFDDVIKRGRLMADPSFLVSNPTRSDPALAPAGHQIYYVLAPAPNLDADIDWAATGPRYREELLAVLEARGYVGFGDAIDVERTVTPWDWERQGFERGTPFAAAHTFWQTGPFRPPNLWGDNVVLAGSGTVPGVGVPMVVISGRLAAERIIGPSGVVGSRPRPRRASARSPLRARPRAVEEPAPPVTR
ncbi:MAG: phytoene desaturase [Actinomycetota bacterium]|nr:MAG: phytoene desaturase [Actinomycetota bacterium]